MDNNLTVRIAQPPGVNMSLSGPGTLYAKSLNYLDFVFSTGVETPNAIVKRDANGYANFTTARTVAGAAAIYATATGGSGTFAIDARGTNGSGAVSGISPSGTSIRGQSTSGIGVYGTSDSGEGIAAYSDTGNGGSFSTGSGFAASFFSFGGNFAEFQSADEGLRMLIDYGGNITTFGTLQAASISADNEIKTSGEDATIWTEGSGGHIYTVGGYIQTGSNFRLSNGTHTTTLSHSPTANRAIAFPNAAGTVALINPSTGTQTFSGAQAFTGAVSVTDATASTTTTTGALKVAGGLGVVGAINAGGSITASGVSNTLPNQTAVTPDSILTRQLADDRYLVNDNASSIIGLALFL